MIRVFFLSSLLLLFLVGCNSSSSTDSEVNRFKPQNHLGYYGDLTLFADQIIGGAWSEYSFRDDNITINNNVFVRYYFKNDGTLEFEYSILAGTIIPVGLYGVSENGNSLYFDEKIGFFYEYIGEGDNNCSEVAKYKKIEENLTFENNVLFCKEF